MVGGLLPVARGCYRSRNRKVQANLTNGEIMKYLIDYQYLPKGAARPRDDGDVVPIEIDGTGYALVPNVGDFVQVVAITTGGNSFQGRVKSRLFRHFQTPPQNTCAVKIVVEETDDDWGMLVKE